MGNYGLTPATGNKFVDVVASTRYPSRPSKNIRSDNFTLTVGLLSLERLIKYWSNFVFHCGHC